MSKFASAMAQTAKIAEETTREMKAKPAKADKAVIAQPHEAEALQAREVAVSDPYEVLEPKAHAAAASEPQEAVKPSLVKRTSTSLYLTPAAHREIRLHAADKGIKSNRVYEDALRDYFKKHKLGDFDDFNNRAS